MSKSFTIAVGCDALFADASATPRPGLCFELVRRIAKWTEDHAVDVIVAVVSSKPPDQGWPMLSVLHDAGIRSASGFFTNGADVVPYVAGMGCDLFLSTELDDVQGAIDRGIPSAVIHGMAFQHDDGPMRLAFDGDAVLLHHDGEAIFMERKLHGFLDHEKENVLVPMAAGPLMPFLRSILRLEDAIGTRLFRTALVTARSGIACERAMRSIAHHGARVDEALFCGDIPKLEILRAFGAQLFFDDSDRHLEPASRHLTAGKVPWRRTPLA